jgi:chitodextrinase
VAAQTTFRAVADAYVSSAKPNTNYGSTSRLKADQSPTMATYLRFDLSSVGASVTRATLFLYSASKSKIGYDVRAVADSSWSEPSITYANAPPAAAAISGSSGPLNSGTWTSVDVSQIVRSGGLVSLGVTSTAQTAISVDSRESGFAPYLTLETSGGADTVAPTAPTNLAVASTGASSVGLTWSSSVDDVGVAGYDVFVNGAKVGSTTGAAYSFTGLSCGTGYTFGVVAFDAAGNRSSAASVVAATAPCPDTAAPTTPGGLSVAATTTTTVSVSWSPSTDNVGVAGYSVFVSGSKVGSTGTTSYTFGGLACGTTYAFGVAAYDTAGNVSPTASVAAATSPCPDTAAPTPPSGLMLTGATSSEISISWLPSTDNVGVTGYDVSVNGSKAGTTGTLAYTLTGLACGTAYTVGVAAYDAAGNRSTSSTVTVSTSACSTGAAPAYRFIYNSDAAASTAASYGWNLIDVGSKWAADQLPAGAKGLLWVGDYDNTTCSWQVSDSSLTTTVTAAVGDAKIAGYFFSDEPDPYACPNAPSQHKARSDLLHKLDPGKFTVLVMDANSGQQSLSQIPLWVGAADYVGLDPYPCYQGKACDYSWIDSIIAAADRAGLAYWGVAQAFSDATWRWPTPDEESHMLAQWSASHESGYMVFAWTWAGNTLSSQPGLLSVFQSFNSGSSGGGDTSPPTTPANLAKTGATQTSVSVGWSASTDNVGVAGYTVYRDGASVVSSGATSATVSGLACGTSYTIAVDAYDAAGNRSPQDSITAATAACTAATAPVVAAAGDICGSPSDCAPTAALLGSLAPDRVLTLGDNAYPDGAASDYTSYYDPNWGKYKLKTSPAPGNHDYHTAGATGYFNYFGSQAPAAYYSYDVGSWHLISLNGELSHSAGSAQEQWLKTDLAAHPASCTLAYWHEPRFSSGGEHGSDTSFDAFWRDLYAAGVEIVLNGHDHDYERFAPQTPDAVANANGIREFVVGTGGASHYTFAAPIANSEVRDNTSFGVLKLTLRVGGYDWAFVPVAGAAFTDSGSGTCH